MFQASIGLGNRRVFSKGLYASFDDALQWCIRMGNIYKADKHLGTVHTVNGYSYENQRWAAIW